MAVSLYSIKPVYKEWINTVNAENIYSKIDEMSDQFKNTIKDILYSAKSDKEIDEEIQDIKKKLLYMELIDRLIIPSENNQTDVTRSKLSDMRESMKLISRYNTDIVVQNQKKSIDVLTIISIIILPMTLITSYFGMNFVRMGTSNTTYGGIFSFEYPQIFVIILSIVSIIIIILVIKKFYKIDM